MVVLPPDGIVLAARRWLRLFSRGWEAEPAAHLLLQDAQYTDLSKNQYAGAYDWLKTLGLVPADGEPPPASLGVSEDFTPELVLFRAVIIKQPPIWLLNADTLIRSPADLPEDARAMAGVLELGDTDTFAAVRQAHAKVDLARRAEVGAAGEEALVDLLEEAWPGACRHVSPCDDSLGFDIELAVRERTWKLEVKSTTRRGSLRVYLSRNEFETARVREGWRLVVVWLDRDLRIAGLATVPTAWITDVVPRDPTAWGRWESVALSLGPGQLEPGLSFVAKDTEHPMFVKGEW